MNLSGVGNCDADHYKWYLVCPMLYAVYIKVKLIYWTWPLTWFLRTFKTWYPLKGDLGYMWGSKWALPISQWPLSMNAGTVQPWLVVGRTHNLGSREVVFAGSPWQPRVGLMQDSYPLCAIFPSTMHQNPLLHPSVSLGHSARPMTACLGHLRSTMNSQGTLHSLKTCTSRAVCEILQDHHLPFLF